MTGKKSRTITLRSTRLVWTPDRNRAETEFELLIDQRRQQHSAQRCAERRTSIRIVFDDREVRTISRHDEFALIPSR